MEDTPTPFDIFDDGRKLPWDELMEWTADADPSLTSVAQITDAIKRDRRLAMRQVYALDRIDFEDVYKTLMDVAYSKGHHTTLARLYGFAQSHGLGQMSDRAALLRFTQTICFIKNCSTDLLKNTPVTRRTYLIVAAVLIRKTGRSLERAQSWQPIA